jgi:hypothetical protein
MGVMTVWQPVVNGKLMSALWVPWNRPEAMMPPQLYRDLLKSRLEEEISQHPPSGCNSGSKRHRRTVQIFAI